MHDILFHFVQVLRTNPVLGAFIITTCVIFMTFILINVFISALLVSFSEERHNPTVRTYSGRDSLLLLPTAGVTLPSEMITLSTHVTHVHTHTHRRVIFLSLTQLPFINKTQEQVANTNVYILIPSCISCLQKILSLVLL